jgi:hypothetical protein
MHLERANAPRGNPTTMTTASNAPGTAAQPQAETRRYVLEGTLLEACNCDVLCPCWIGEDPDNGTCDSFVAYHIDKGTVGDTDVSGLTLVVVAHIPGNILKGNFRAVHLIDDRATPEQRAALSDAFMGRLGGPLADLAGLIGEYLGAVPAPVDFQLIEGQGSITVGGKLRSVMAPYKSLYGTTTTLRDSIFSTIPGSPAWVSKASETVVNLPEHGLVWSLKDRNAIQGEFKFEG